MFACPRGASTPDVRHPEPSHAFSSVSLALLSASSSALILSSALEWTSLAGLFDADPVARVRSFARLALNARMLRLSLASERAVGASGEEVLALVRTSGNSDRGPFLL
jgi:hypothetical protein